MTKDWSGDLNATDLAFIAFEQYSSSVEVDLFSGLWDIYLSIFPSITIDSRSIDQYSWRFEYYYEGHLYGHMGWVIVAVDNGDMDNRWMRG